MKRHRNSFIVTVILVFVCACAAAQAQLAPNAEGDSYGRTPLHVATFARQREAIRVLVFADAAKSRGYQAMVALLESAGAR